MKFAHPGTVMSADMIRALRTFSSKDISKREPTKSWLEALKKVSLDIESGAKEVLKASDNPIMMKAGEHVYKATIAFLYTNDAKYAKTALRILSDWSMINTKWNDEKSRIPEGNGPLQYGWMVASFAKSVEILRNIYPPWDTNFEHQFNRWIDRVVLPILKNNPNKSGNWCSTINEARLQLAIFRDDENEFRDVAAAIKKRIEEDIDTDGVNIEQFRDGWHNQAGIAGLIQSCEIAWHQGIDLYSTKDNVLLKATELQAHMINIAPKNPNVIQKHIDWSVQHKDLPISIWRKLVPWSFGIWPRKVLNQKYWPSGYEIALNHYVRRKKMNMPETEKLAARHRPEPYGFHHGYGTYTHFLIHPVGI
jgi:hypothetical protein